MLTPDFNSNKSKKTNIVWKPQIWIGALFKTDVLVVVCDKIIKKSWLSISKTAKHNVLIDGQPHYLSACAIGYRFIVTTTIKTLNYKRSSYSGWHVTRPSFLLRKKRENFWSIIVTGRTSLPPGRRGGRGRGARGLRGVRGVWVIMSAFCYQDDRREKWAVRAQRVSSGFEYSDGLLFLMKYWEVSE